MKYYSVKFAMVVAELGELSLADPYVYEAESIPQLVADIAPVCGESLVIVSIQPATDAEVFEYLHGPFEDEEPEYEEPDWDEYDDEFWEELIAEAEGL